MSLPTSNTLSTSIIMEENSLVEYNYRIASDSDRDGINDDYEIRVLGSSPLHFDSDSDGLSDGEEFYLYSTNLSLIDSDGDGVDDKTEIVTYGSDPNSNSNPELFEKELNEFNWSIGILYLADIDDDGVADEWDNCPQISNANQENSDRDLKGDECDSTPDGVEDDSGDSGSGDSGSGYYYGGGSGSGYSGGSNSDALIAYDPFSDVVYIYSPSTDQMYVFF